MNLSRLRLVTFDITDTLLAFRMSPIEKYAEVAANYNIQCNKDLLSKNFKKTWKLMNANHPIFGHYSGLGYEQWWKHIVRGTFQDANFSNDKDVLLEKLSVQLLEVYKSFNCWKYCTGVLDLLSYLRYKKIMLGVISNFDPRLHVTLRNAKLDHYFKFIITSYEAGVQKPDAEIFLKALKLSEVNNLQPGECLHVGNTIVTDYKGAIGAGWQAALIYNGDVVSLQKEYDFVKTEHVFPSCFDLHKAFVDINRESLLIQSTNNSNM